VEQGRSVVDLAALEAQVEADRIPLAGDEEARGAAIAVELGIAEGGGERAVGGAEDAEVEGEAVVERGDRAAPDMTPARLSATGVAKAWPEPPGSRRSAVAPEGCSQKPWIEPPSRRPRKPASVPKVIRIESPVTVAGPSRPPIAARQPCADRRIVSGPRGAGPKSAR
jgi:hypothetical protein